MRTRKLLGYVSAFTVVFILMALLTKYALHDDANWHDVSGQGLNSKIQTGLTQMYWQWQGNGRANRIEYWPENAEQGFIIEMDAQGLPIVDNDERGCLQFLYWFVDEKLLNKNVNVTTTFIQTQTNVTGAQNKNIENGTAMCQFQYADKFYTYDLNSGQLRFTH